MQSSISGDSEDASLGPHCTAARNMAWNRFGLFQSILVPSKRELVFLALSPVVLLLTFGSGL